MGKTKFWFVSLIASLIFFAGCSQYDDAPLWDKVNSNTKRIENLETQIADINKQVQELKVICDALKNNLTIKTVHQTTDGYIITFSDGTFAYITNGKDGANGRDGKDGLDGKDGKDGKDGADGANGKDAPVVGVELFEGEYYWVVTINGETTWLTDAEGNKMRVSGRDGEDGTASEKGEPGKDGKDGVDGKDGADGADGITPIFGVDSHGYWIVSYDNGQSYTYVLDVNGEKVLAHASADTSVSSFFTDVYVGYDYLQVTLINGTVVQIPIVNEIALKFLGLTDIELSEENASVTIPFSVVGYYVYSLFIETCVHGNMKVHVDYNGGSNGSITITRTGEIEEGSKVIVFLCDDKRTITYVINVSGYSDPRLPQVVPNTILPGLRDHMPIYEGVNPPIINGEYLMDDPRVVYCADEGVGGWSAGTTGFAPMYLRFSNQDSRYNTLDYAEKEGDSSAAGQGAFISGSGNNFTAFFNTEGLSSGIYTKTAIVMSGTWTSTGIKNIYYAFVMVDKGNDSNHELMDVGVFRIFDESDGFASRTSWSYYAPETRGLTKALKFLNSYNK